MGAGRVVIPALLLLFLCVVDSDSAASSSNSLNIPARDEAEQRRTPLQFVEGCNPRKLQRRLLAGTGARGSPDTPPAPAHLLSKPPMLPPTHLVSTLRQKKKKRTIAGWAVLALIVGGCLLGIALLALCLLFFCYYKPKDRGLATGKPAAAPLDTTSPAAYGTHDGGNSTYAQNRLVFFEGSGLAFDLEDLLRASAELLGKGTIGTSYKAALDDGTEIVVKRLAKCAFAVGQREFERHMVLIGDGSSCLVNVAPLRAYYCSRDERLVVYDYYERGSVADLLHGDEERKEKGGRLLFDWDARLSVALGAARGVAHIHGGSGGDSVELRVHGNIKSSNVLLTSDLRPHVSEAGLAVLLQAAAASHPQSSTDGGYRAPELQGSRNKGKVTGGDLGGATTKAIHTQESDVYAFGVFLLELVTGRPPMEVISSNIGTEAMHLVKWVHSVLREEWTAEVFDAELVRSENGADEDELLEMLKIAMACVATEPRRRPPMTKVVKAIEGLASSKNTPHYHDDTGSRRRE